MHKIFKIIVEKIKFSKFVEKSIDRGEWGLVY